MSIALVDAMAAIREAEPEEIILEISILEAEIIDLQKQIEQRRSAISLLKGLVPSNDHQDENDEETLTEDLPKEATHRDNYIPPSRRWRMIHKLLLNRGPMRCSDIHKATNCSNTCQTTYNDMKKREGHYFLHRDDGRWEAVKIALPIEGDGEAE
jgi:hypothetical protein